MGSSKSVETEQKQREEDHEKLGEQYKKLLSDKSEQIEQIRARLESNKTVPNALQQMAKLLDIEGSNIGDVQKVVEAMKDSWEQITKDMDNIQKVVGANEVNDLKYIRYEYFTLLSETKRVISGLIEQAQVKRRTIGKTLKVARKAYNGGNGIVNADKLEEIDLLHYKDGIRSIRKWIDQKELSALSEKWHKICYKLKEKRNVFGKAFDKYRKQKFWKRVLIATGCVIAVGVTIAAIIFSAGAATSIAAVIGFSYLGGVLPAECIVAGGIGLSLGAISVGSSIWYGYKQTEMLRSFEKVMRMIDEMLETSNTITDCVVKMKIQTTLIDQNIIDDFKDIKAMDTIIESLRKIDDYLVHYVSEGENVIESVNKACKQFLQ